MESYLTENKTDKNVLMLLDFDPERYRDPTSSASMQTTNLGSIVSKPTTTGSNEESFKPPELLDVDCGEPFRAQFLRFDFTPVKGVDDNIYLEQKCIDFWEFVNETEELKNMFVMPEIKKAVKTLDEPILTEELFPKKEEIIRKESFAHNWMEEKGT